MVQKGQICRCKIPK